MMIALMLAALLAQDVQEQEPNDKEDEIRQSIAPGGAFVGTISGVEDRDWFAIECKRETVCSLYVKAPGPLHLELHLENAGIVANPDYNPVQLLRVRLPAGRSRVFIWADKALEYRLETQVVTDPPEGKEVEPNNSEQLATPLDLGSTVWGQASGVANECDWYAIQVAQAGAHHLVLKRLRPDAKARLGGTVTISNTPCTYRLRELDDEFHFYPVLPAGTNNVCVYLFSDTPVGDAYELRIEPHDIRVTADEVRRAEAAIERAVAFLMKPPAELGTEDKSIAAEGLALAALSEGRGAKGRAAALERDFVARLERRFTACDGTWQGKPVFRLGESPMEGSYAHPMATLGLAEAAVNGSAKARELAARAADYLLASQQTERKCKEWQGPVDRKHEAYGGWRYDHHTIDSDLSVTGWCAVALTAVDAAGIQRPGLRDALADAVVGINHFGTEAGFGYDTPGGDGTSVCNSIGALICLLYGEETGALGRALQLLDLHLPAATQVDVGHLDYFYYVYYATRANYLRSGRVWETWRSAALRQLLRRQRADGSWLAFDVEEHAGDRWTTAIALMVLRLCLNEAPKYLKLEVRGF